MPLAVFGGEVDAAVDRVSRVRGQKGWPSSDIEPPSAGVTPKITCISSVRPAPTSPAKPRISPRRASKLTPRGAPGHDAGLARRAPARALPRRIARALSGKRVRERPADHHRDDLVVRRFGCATGRRRIGRRAGR